MSKHREVCVTVFERERYDGEWPPEDEAGFLAWFTDKFSEVPKEFRGSLTVRIDSHSGYSGSHNPGIEIEYTRPETDEELAKREAQEQRASQDALNVAYSEYVKLKAKFEQK